jgi:hypothetical protein
VKEMALEICKFSLNDPTYLNYRPSIIAACSIIISLNLFEINSGENKNFFKNKINSLDLLEMNVEIWNNQ